MILYHDNEPQGRAFDKDSAEQALRVGWYEKSEKVIKSMFPEEGKKDAPKKRKKQSGGESKHRRTYKKRQTKEASHRNSPGQSREVKEIEEKKEGGEVT